MSNSVCNHTRGKQIRLALRRRPALRTELDFTQSQVPTYLRKVFSFLQKDNIVTAHFGEE